jgi:hypothetical protein
MSAAVGTLLATERGGIHSKGRPNKVLAYAKLQESRTCIWGTEGKELGGERDGERKVLLTIKK